MAVRTTATLVEGIMDVPSTLDLTGFIETASKLTDRVEDAGETDTDLLELIERWLTAHFVTATVEPQATLKQIDITETRWHIPKGGEDLRSTPYGRTAIALDKTNTLDCLSAEKSYTVWIGDDDPDDAS